MIKVLSGPYKNLIAESLEALLDDQCAVDFESASEEAKFYFLEWKCDNKNENETDTAWHEWIQSWEIKELNSTIEFEVQFKVNRFGESEVIPAFLTQASAGVDEEEYQALYDKYADYKNFDGGDLYHPCHEALLEKLLDMGIDLKNSGLTPTNDNEPYYRWD